LKQHLASGRRIAVEIPRHGDRSMQMLAGVLIGTPVLWMLIIWALV
jgi:hypothetical protein